MPQVKPRAPRLNGHSASQGLVWAALPGADIPYEILGRGLLTVVDPANGNNTADTIFGKALFSGSTTLAGGYYPWSERITGVSRELTIIVWADITVMADYGKLWCSPYNPGVWTSPYGNLSFEKTGATSAATLSYASSGPTINSIDSDTGFLDTTSGMSQYVVTKSAANVNFYKNGVKHGTTKTITNNAISWQKNPVHVFQRNFASLGEGMTGNCAVSMLWSRALDASEIQQLFVNPFLGLTPRKRKEVFRTAVVAGGSVAKQLSALGVG